MEACDSRGDAGGAGGRLRALPPPPPSALDGADVLGVGASQPMSSSGGETVTGALRDAGVVGVADFAGAPWTVEEEWTPGVTAGVDSGASER